MTTDDSQPRFYYGWVMLAVAIMLALASMPGQTVLVALFNGSIRESLGLLIIQLSAAYTVGTIVASLPLPLVGKIADRIGLRLTVLVVGVGFALALVLLREAIGVVTLGACFFLVRLLGQGSLSMLAGHTISMWFERRLGIAQSALSVAGFAAGSAILPQPTAWMIARFGWQNALLVLAGFVFALTFPAAVFLFRNKPEDIGQHLDGDPGEHEEHDVMHGGVPPAGDPAFTVRQAMSTRAYWIIVPSMVASGLVGTVLIFHMQTMLHGAGLEGSERQAAIAFQPWPIAFGVMTLVVGWLVDCVRPSLLLPLGGLFMMTGTLICVAASRAMPPESMILFVMATGMGVYGMGQATIFGVGFPTIARYFGRTHHGAIRGTMSTAIVAGTGAGPLLAGWAYEVSGQNFSPVLLGLAALGVPMAMAAMMLRAPEPPAERDLVPHRDEPDLPGPVL